MQKEVTILKADVMPEVYKITGYTAKDTEQEKIDSDKISATEDELSLLETYYNESLTSLNETLSHYGYIGTDDALKCVFELTLPSNWDSNYETALQKNMNQYIVFKICQMWFNISKKNEVEYYAASCESLRMKIVKILNERVKPTRS